MALASSKLYILRDVDGVATKFPSETLPLILTTYTYSAQRMGSAPTLEATVYYDRCLDKEWTKEEYIEFNGERFYVDRIPSSTKDTSSHLYKHEITLTSRRQILDNTLFFDAVSDSDTDTSGGDAYRSNMTSFTFGGTIEEFVARINSSLIYCDLYDTATQNGYKVVLDDGYATDEVQEISFEDKYITEVLQEIYNTYGLNYYWVGKTCHIGDVEQEISNTIQYGASDALLSVDKENANNQLVDMATGYGSSDNIPYYYPNSDQYGSAIFETGNCEKSDVFSVELSTVMGWESALYNNALTLIKYANDGSYSKSLGIGGTDSAIPTSGKTMTADSDDWCYVESNLETYARSSSQYQYTGGAPDFLRKTVVSQNDAKGLKFNATIGMNPYWETSVPNNVYDSYQGIRFKNIEVHKFVKVRNAKRFTEKIDFSEWIKPAVTIKKVWTISGNDKNITEHDITKTVLAEKSLEAIAVLENIGVYTANNGVSDGSKYWTYFPSSSYNFRWHYYYRDGYKKQGDTGLRTQDGPWRVWTELSNTYYAFDESEDEVWLEFVVGIFTDNMLYDDDGNEDVSISNTRKFWFAEIDVEFTGDIKRVFEPGETGYNMLSDSGKSAAYAESGVTFIDVDKMPAAEYSYAFNDSTNTWDLTVSGADEAAKIRITGREWIYPTSKLMPSIYRTSAGKERFLYALDNTHLLPGSTSEYYTFENQYTKGNPHQGVETFDDIKPTIKDMKNAGGDLIGEVLDVAYDENDSDLTTTNGNSSEEYLHPYFYIKLHKFDGENGFDLFKHALESDTAKIEMTVSQGCPACAFEIQKGTLDADTNSFFNPVKTDSDGNIASGDYDNKIVSSYTDISENNQNSVTNEIWIAVKKDNSTLGVVMPNVAGNFKVKKGDKFVITGIKMPTAYVLAAEKRLDAAIVKWMSENNSEEFNYSIKFSRIFLAQHPDFAKKLNENVRLHISYNGVEHTLYVSDYTLKADSNILQEVSVELTKELGTNTSDAMSIANSITNIYNGEGGGLSLEAADQRYLSKRSSDIAAGRIQFKDGILLGEKYLLDKSGQAWLDKIQSLDYSAAAETGFSLNRMEGGKYRLALTALEVWGKATFNELEIRKISYTGGSMILSAAGSTLVLVRPYYEITEDGVTAITYTKPSDDAQIKAYRCWLLADDGTTATQNTWQVDDQAICKTFNTAQVGSNSNASNTYYWRLVTAISPGPEVVYGADGAELFGGQACHWVDLSPTDRDTLSDDAPSAGDVIAQLGNRTDTSRQNAVVEYTEGDDAPRRVAYKGVCGYTLEGHVVYDIGPEQVYIKSSSFSLIAEDGNYVKQVTYRGQYSSSTSYGYYDEVTYNGTRWLCIVPEGSTATEAPSASSSQWRATTTVLTPQLQIFHDLGAGIAIGESHTVVVKAYLGDEEITSKITKWSVSRNTGQAVEDAAWANKDKVKNFAGTLLIVWTDEEDDLGISETGYTTFTFEATTADGELLSTELTFQG